MAGATALSTHKKNIPSHDTLCDVIAAINPDLFKTCLLAWVEGLLEDTPEVIAMDGKTSRRSHARGKGRLPLHTVSAWATQQRLVLGQEAVAEKANEILAIPLLLRRLEYRLPRETDPSHRMRHSSDSPGSTSVGLERWVRGCQHGAHAA